jgi:hypothetical protein
MGLGSAWCMFSLPVRSPLEARNVKHKQNNVVAGKIKHKKIIHSVICPAVCSLVILDPHRVVTSDYFSELIAVASFHESPSRPI